MIARFKTFWAERTGRERVLLGVMFGIAAVMLLWFGLAKPMMAARERAELRLASASAEAGLIAARKAVRSGDEKPYRGSVPAADLVKTMGTAAGFTVTRADNDGSGGVALAVASAKAPALFNYLAGLERQGLRVATLDLRANPDGSLAAEAVLK